MSANSRKIAPGLGLLLVLAAAVPFPVAAEEQDMAENPRLSLQVVEVIHYCADVDASLAFYSERLGWSVIWQAPGNLAVLDAGGAYQAVLVAARWSSKWEEGQAVPPPLLSLQSQDLAADLEILAARGLPGIVVQGDPEDMLFASIPFVEGLELFAWQDSEPGGASKVAEEYRKRGGTERRYKLGECIYFVDDIAPAMSLLMEKLGFTVKEQHGEVYTALHIGEGPVVGLFDLPALLRQPVFSPGPGRTRLFFECPDLDAEHARQEAAGALPGEVFREPDGLAWFSTGDPDGNPITFWRFSPPAADAPAG